MEKLSVEEFWMNGNVNKTPYGVMVIVKVEILGRLHSYGQAYLKKDDISASFVKSNFLEHYYHFYQEDFERKKEEFDLKNIK